MLVTTFWVKIPGQGWNASDLDRMLLVALRPLRPCWPRGCRARPPLVGTWRSGDRIRSSVAGPESLLLRADQLIE